MKVLTLADCSMGRAKFVVVDDLKIRTFLPILQANIAKEAFVHTDDAMHYDNLRNYFAMHGSVNHCQRTPSVAHRQPHAVGIPKAVNLKA